MIETAYRRQVALLLAVLPEVAKEKCFALHGGTAINLFVREMPRLSVDIDLTYVPVEDRAESLANIGAALGRIKVNIEKAVRGAQVADRSDIGKLLVTQSGVAVKLEVNLVGRGALSDPVEMPLCARAQEEFEAFCAIQVVPLEQLYGGKICAALDRQHPRDLFDVKYLLENEGFTDRIKTGFIFSLLASDRPLHEVISPNFQDQRQALENHFSGMSMNPFSYEEYESVRAKLVDIIHKSMTAADKQFLLGVNALEPDWSTYDFSPFPAIKWKMQNLQKLKAGNPDKHREQHETLKKILYSL